MTSAALDIAMTQRSQTYRGRALKRFIVQLFALAIVCAPLLTTLTPLSNASATHVCTMSCCIGKGPHAAGSCSSGLLKKLRAIEPETEVLCGLDRITISSSAQLSPESSKAAPIKSQETDRCGEDLQASMPDRSAAGTGETN